MSVSFCCVLVYILTYAYECIRGTEFSYNENDKFEYILITLKRKNLLWGKSGPICWGYFTIYIIVVFPKTDYEGKVALSVGDISQ